MNDNSKNKHPHRSDLCTQLEVNRVTVTRLHHLPMPTSRDFPSCITAHFPSACLPNPLPSMPQCLPRWKTCDELFSGKEKKTKNWALKGFPTSVLQTEQYYFLNPKAVSSDSLPHLLFTISAGHAECPLPAFMLEICSEDKPCGSKEVTSST